MNTSADAPYLDCAYKLEEYDGRARRKRSLGKATWPGRKQVWRHCAADGIATGDTLTVAGDDPGGTPLLVPAMRQGRRLDAADALAAARVRLRVELARLPARLRTLDETEPYPVRISPALVSLAAAVDART